MARRRYSYSYSPTPRGERIGRRSKGLNGWVILGVAAGVVVAAVVFHQAFAGGGDGDSFAAESPCWKQVACSAERVESGKSSDRVAGDAQPDESVEIASPKIVRRDNEDPPSLAVYAYAVLEEPCGALVQGYNAHERYSPASLTKIATALVAAEHTDLRQSVHVTVDGAALSSENDATVMGLIPGQSLSMTDLLYGMLLPSGNDAAIQIAEQVAGSTEDFVALMNAHIATAGLQDTQFKNPHGLDERGHYTSAYDIAKLGSELLRNPSLAHIVSRRAYQPAWNGPALRNLNLLLGQYPGAIGVKTGYTYQAGQTIVVAAEREGRRYIVSILGSSDIFVDATTLLDWAFESAPPSCAPARGNQVAAAR